MSKDRFVAFMIDWRIISMTSMFAPGMMEHYKALSHLYETTNRKNPYPVPLSFTLKVASTAAKIDINMLKRDEYISATQIRNREVVYETYQKPQDLVVEINDSLRKFNSNLYRDIHDCMYAFYEGEKTVEEVTDFFRAYCNALLAFNVVENRTTGTNVKDNHAYISRIYANFSSANSRMAVAVNYIEGAKINNIYRGLEYDFLYYNADYYYKCDEMREILRQVAGEMATKWNVPKIEFDKVGLHSNVTYNEDSSFNRAWDSNARGSRNRGNIIDFRIAPPKGFKMFYKEGPYIDTDKGHIGLLKLSIGKLNIKMDVPYRMAVAGKKVEKSFFNLSELIQVKSENNDDYKKLNRFLRNLNVFTRWWHFVNYRTYDFSK